MNMTVVLEKRARAMGMAKVLDQSPQQVTLKRIRSTMRLFTIQWTRAVLGMTVQRSSQCLN